MYMENGNGPVPVLDRSSNLNRSHGICQISIKQIKFFKIHFRISNSYFTILLTLQVVLVSPRDSAHGKLSLKLGGSYALKCVRKSKVVCNKTEFIHLQTEVRS